MEVLLLLALRMVQELTAMSAPALAEAHQADFKVALGFLRCLLSPWMILEASMVFLRVAVVCNTNLIMLQWLHKTVMSLMLQKIPTGRDKTSHGARPWNKRA